MPAPVLPGATPWSHRPPGRGGAGALVLHGFTGSPASVRGLAEAFAEAGLHVELPRLPGHGTVVDEMLGTGWDDWTTEVARAHDELAARVDQVVVAGLSMGGALALWTALHEPELAGVICVNPVTRPRRADEVEMLHELLADGMEVVPGGGADIADPAAVDLSYPGTPVRPLLSLVEQGLRPMADRYGELAMPLRLFTSRHDHVVEPTDSEHLAATYGGPVEHTWLERSYHVATLDHDRELVVAGAVEFALRVAGS